MLKRVKNVVVKKVRRGVRRIVAQVKGLVQKTPKTTKEMTSTEKRSRIAQKNRLGQPLVNQEE